MHFASENAGLFVYMTDTFCWQEDVEKSGDNLEFVSYCSLQGCTKHLKTMPTAMGKN